MTTSLRSLLVGLIAGSVLTLSATRLGAETAATQSAPASPAPGQVLTTPNYVVTIIDKRGDADASDTVTYIGVSRRTGKSLRLVGGDLRRMTSDGPGRVLGYVFKNGNVTYRVYREGELQVVRGDKILLDEDGTWN